MSDVLKMKSEKELKEIAEQLSQTIRIRTKEGNDIKRDATNEEQKALYNVFFSALFTANQFRENYNDTIKSVIKHNAETTIDLFISDCNGYLSVYNPLDNALTEWAENSKLEQVQAEKKNWTDLLDKDVRERLWGYCGMQTTKEDILPLTQAYWNAFGGKNYAVEDALIAVLNIVNDPVQIVDLTEEERDDILYEVSGIQREEKELDLTQQDEHRGR